MGRCKFKDSWLEDVRFRSWLSSVANPHHRVFKVLNFIEGGIKKSLKFDMLKPADTLYEDSQNVCVPPELLRKGDNVDSETDRWRPN
jgi:hypothetical protein